MEGSQKTEVEFTFRDSGFFLFNTADETGCEFELEMLLPWTDGNVLKFFTTRGADAEQIMTYLDREPEVLAARLINLVDDIARLKLVTEGKLSRQLASEGSILTDISISAGQGTVKAAILPHTDASSVIEGFIETFPAATLTARRLSNRPIAFTTGNQIATELVSSLTEKQFRVLRVAHARGYFKSPRGATGEEIAADLGISSATFSQHLRAGLDKLLGKLFD